VSLRATVRAGVKTAMKSVGDLKSTFTLLHRVMGVYDPITDTTTATTTSTTVEGLLVGFEQREIDGENVKTDDQRALIDADLLPGIFPEKNDKITIDGVTWNVQRILSPPTYPLWILQIRKV